MAEENQGIQPVVVELFTSQGCSSCPPADAFLERLAVRRGVIALALHVDYWDYIGWKDSFGDPAFTIRQRSYARAAGRSMVYTPQIIVSGHEDIVGTHMQQVSDLITRYQEGKVAPSGIALSVTRNGDQLSISARAEVPLDTPLEVQVIRYRPHATVHVTRGENAGQDLDYTHIVTGIRRLQSWDTAQPLRARAQVEGDAPVVVLLQRPGPGRIEAATLLR